MKTTTSIDQVPTACAALWAPYDVTKVPPPDIIQKEHVPPAPRVVNMTNGAVSDAEAQLWANASNNGSGWFKWAEANDQPGFLRHLAGAAVLSAQEQQALSQGADIDQPNCNLYPSTNTVFAVGVDGRSYFARKGLPSDSPYVLVAAYSGPCSETIRYPDGHSTSLVDFAGPTIVFVPGSLRTDPVLGDIWYTDAGGNCSDSTGPPPEWCGR